ncbi:hypothetical protein PInf_001208 [Phytophthora infestans]|nr:hypothetical protein PInf_001208 [Phytophthora infestans]
MNSVTGPSLPNGYLAVGLVLPDRVIPTLLAEAKARTYTGVFNRVGGGDDSYRQQSRVDSAALSPALLELRKALAVVIGMLHPGWKPGVFSFMRSKPGGTEQEASFAAQYEASSLRQMLRCQGRQQRAHCGNSHLIHSGVAFIKSNYRVHCYLSYDDVHWTPDVVQNALPSHGVCGFCGVKMLKGPGLRKHRYLCEQNPDGASNRLKRKREGKEGVFKCELCPNVEYPVASSLRSHKSRVHGSGQ